MGNKESVIGLGILGIVAYLWFRNKGDNVVPQNNPIKEIEFRNLQQQEQFLTKELETDISQGSTLLQQTQRTVNWLSQAVAGQKQLGHTDIFVRTRAENQLRINKLALADESRILEQRKAALKNDLGESFDIQNTQSFYNAATLDDIRQRLNSSEFSQF